MFNEFLKTLLLLQVPQTSEDPWTYREYKSLFDTDISLLFISLSSIFIKMQIEIKK